VGDGRRGIALIAPGVDRGRTPLGIAFALLAGVCWGDLHGPRRAPLAAGRGGTLVTAAMVVATAVTLPSRSQRRHRHLTPRLALASAAVALLSSALPYSLEMVALRALPVRTFSILMSLEPAAAALCGFAFLGERWATRSGSRWRSDRGEHRRDGDHAGRQRADRGVDRRWQLRRTLA